MFDKFNKFNEISGSFRRFSHAKLTPFQNDL